MRNPSPTQRQEIPDWFRWLALLSLVLWFAAYWHAWGPANFLHLCDIAVILTCIGLYTNSALLISSQAVSSVLIDLVWTLDVAARLIFGRHLIGGTEYLFDATTPLWARLLSLFHIILPIILLWSLSPPRLRSPRVETAVRHPATSIDSLALRDPGPKPKFRRERPVPPSLLRPRPHAPRHHFPVPGLGGLFPHSPALQPPVSAALRTGRPRAEPIQIYTTERIE